MNMIYTFPPLPLPRPNARAADPGARIPFGGPSWHIFDFLALRNSLQILLRKNMEKVRKMLDFDLSKPSPNPSKSNQNQRPEKHWNFHRFSIDFCCLLQKPNLDFCAHGHSFVRFLHNSRVRFWHAFWKWKPCQQPFHNEAWTLQKSMPETCRFSTSIFGGFGLDLGGPWASKMEPSSLFWPPETSEQLFFYPLKLKVF